MTKKKLLSIATIGNKGHAKKIISMINSSRVGRVNLCYKPNSKKNYKKEIDKLSELLNHDAVFILSPNDTHYFYLKYLMKNFKGYIYCEKPPVVNKTHLKFIKKYKNKVYYNFNLRFSYYKKIISKIMEKEKILKINFVDCHGLAYKKNYKTSWRSNKKRHPYGVIETVMIHYIDLCIYLFGSIIKSNYENKISSKIGNAIDTANSNILFKSGIIVDIFNSYAAPALEKIEIVTNNSLYFIEKNKCYCYSPRDSFDSNGRFKKPKISEIISFGKKELWTQSQEKSVLFFLDLVKNKKNVPKKIYDTSIATNKELLKIDI
tara:strand:- start:14376 stop:15332 length:957 start_codon:yes stop_codon:yes gene_type:complete